MSLTLTIALLWSATLAGAVVAWFALFREQAPRCSNRSSDHEDKVVYNVDISQAEPPDCLTLSCPHCGFTGPMDDLTIIGETVDCPLCEGPFDVLEPESITQGS